MTSASSTTVLEYIYESECVYSSFPNAEEVVFRIDGGFLTAESVDVTDNVGPFGVMALSNVEAVVNGDWSFERNLVCLGGTLALNKTELQCRGNLYFFENKGIDENNKSTAGLLLNNSATLNLTGNIKSSGNEGYNIMSVQSISSHISTIRGVLNLTSNPGDCKGISLTRDSKLTINDGALVVHNNVFRRQIILVDNSELSVSGIVSVVNNPSQIVVYNGKLTLRGDIQFQGNAISRVCFTVND